MRLVSSQARPRPATPLRRSLGVASRLGLALAVAIVAANPSPPPAFAQADAETRPAPAADPALDRLFAALAAAPDDASAAAARERIEALWQASGSATADLLTTRAATAALAGERGLALDLLDAAIVVAPAWAGGHHSRALLHLSGHEVERAAADLAEVLRMEPRHFRAMAVMASILATGGRKAEALKWLRRIAAIDPRSPGLAAHIEHLALEVEGREL